MGEEKNNSHSDDYENVFQGSEDKKIREKEPPNDKIIFFKLPKE
ncbi:MAG: hypothetical protein BAJALOKI1v1_290024 [Promethearchaeota archaeon]|nr:MAG: hypothetical protein BAJALOKI1v1_290024 [Candidatus Lokiarchaeota archaeon]